jgi:hypothetical protein
MLFAMKIYFMLLVFFALCGNVNSADIDDNIDDSSIDDYHEMGRIKRNTSFIVLNALKRASLNVTRKETVIDKNKKNTAVSGVIVESGGVVEGDIIIIDKSIGDKIAVSK